MFVIFQNDENLLTTSTLYSRSNEWGNTVILLFKEFGYKFHLLDSLLRILGKQQNSKFC